MDHFLKTFFIPGIAGVSDILNFYKVNLPPNIDYAFAFLAFTMEGILFANHLHGRSLIDSTVFILVHN